MQIALGTDAGGGAAGHGRIVREAELMIESGMEAGDGLMAGTSSATRLIGETESGTVEERRIADMVLRDLNPLDSIGAMRLIAAVYQAGRCVP